MGASLDLLSRKSNSIDTSNQSMGSVSTPAADKVPWPPGLAHLEPWQCGCACNVASEKTTLTIDRGPGFLTRDYALTYQSRRTRRVNEIGPFLLLPPIF